MRNGTWCHAACSEQHLRLGYLHFDGLLAHQVPVRIENGKNKFCIWIRQNDSDPQHFFIRVLNLFRHKMEFFMHLSTQRIPGFRCGDGKCGSLLVRRWGEAFLYLSTLFTFSLCSEGPVLIVAEPVHFWPAPTPSIFFHRLRLQLLYKEGFKFQP